MFCVGSDTPRGSRKLHTRWSHTTPAMWFSSKLSRMLHNMFLSTVANFNFLLFFKLRGMLKISEVCDCYFICRRITLHLTYWQTQNEHLTYWQTLNEHLTYWQTLNEHLTYWQTLNEHLTYWQTLNEHLTYWQTLNEHLTYWQTLNERDTYTLTNVSLDQVYIILTSYLRLRFACSLFDDFVMHV